MLFRISIACCALVIVSVASAQTATPNGPQLNIAHRGASGYAPEHTFFAYDMAMEMDVDMLECDLFLTADEVPVCVHDTTVDRTSDGTGEVSSFTLAQLRDLDFGTWFNDANPSRARPEYVGAKIVPFEEQLDCYLRHNRLMRFHVETKDSAGGRAEQVTVDVLTRKGLIATGNVAGGNIQSSTVLLQSFDATSLERIKQLAPSLPTAFLYPGGTAGASAAIAGQAQSTGDGPAYIDGYAPNSTSLTNDPGAVDRFHAAGNDVHTWTVNSASQMDQLLNMGVDGIFTNFPDVLRTAIDNKGTGTTPEQRGNPSSIPHGCPGIAGRVTSNQGPGDVWEPTGLRGVQLKNAPYNGTNRLLTGSVGAFGLSTLGLLVVAGLVRVRRLRR